MKNYIIFTVFILASVLLLQACANQKQHVNTNVISIEKIIDKNAPNHELCSSLTLTKGDVLKFFSIAKRVSEYEFHHEAIILPCKYQGTININGNFLKWEIMAGGAGYLYNDELINRRYLCKKDCCNVLSNLC